MIQYITTDEGMTWNQIYAVLASAMGAPLCAAYVASKFLAVCGRAAGYDFEGPLLGDKAANVRFDNTKIKRLVPDFAPRVSMAQGIRGAVEYLLAHPEMQTPDPEFDTYTATAPPAPRYGADRRRSRRTGPAGYEVPVCRYRAR